DLGKGNAERARHMSGTKSGARLGLTSGEAACGARIDDLRALIIERHLHVAEHGHGARVHLGVERIFRTFDRTGLGWSAFRFPGGQAAIEDIDLARTEYPERPPDARSRVETAAIVDDDRIFLRNSEIAGGRAELVGSRQHVGQLGRMIGDRVDVEEHRARNMRGNIFGPGIAVLRWKVVGPVDDDDIRLAELAGKPFGGLEPAARCSCGVHRCGQSILMRTIVQSFRQGKHANAARTRRFCLPFFSICVTRTAPISPVARTCVPPQGCRSSPAISMRRTCQVPIGGFTDIVFTRPGLASSSASVIQRLVTRALLAIISATFAVIASLSRPASGMSKSSRLSLSPTEPPVTA